METKEKTRRKIYLPISFTAKIHRLDALKVLNDIIYRRKHKQRNGHSSYVIIHTALVLIHSQVAIFILGYMRDDT